MAKTPFSCDTGPPKPSVGWLGLALPAFDSRRRRTTELVLKVRKIASHLANIYILLRRVIEIGKERLKKKLNYYWCWPTGLAVPGSSPAWDGDLLLVNGAPLQTAFHYFPPIILT